MHCHRKQDTVLHFSNFLLPDLTTHAVTTDEQVAIGFTSNHRDCGAQDKQVIVESQCSAPALLVCRGKCVPSSNFDLNNSVFQANEIGHLLLVLTGNSSFDCW